MRTTGIRLVAMTPVLVVFVASVTPVSSVAAADVARSAWAQALRTRAPAVEPGALLVTLAAPGSARALPHLPDVTYTRLTSRVFRAAVRAGSEQFAASLLRARAEVLAVEPVVRARALRVPNDPSYPYQWAHVLADAASGWETTTGRQDVRVAIVDTGVLGDHRDLAANLTEQAVVSGGIVERVRLHSDNDRCVGTDAEGHGTFVAGVTGAEGDNGVDAAGVSWHVGLVDIAVFSPHADSCTAPTDDVIAALGYAIEHPDGPVDVVNLSLGGPAQACPVAYQTAIDEARGAGIVVVAAAGNEESTRAGQSYVPASCNGVISVGAVAPDGQRAYYSQTNAHVDVVAPGGDLRQGLRGGILSTDRNRSVSRDQGTSFSAPYVAGLAALLRAADALISVEEVEGVVEATARDGGEPGHDDAYGAGVVDVGAALARVAAGRPYPQSQPDPGFPVAHTQPSSGAPPIDPVVGRVWDERLPTTPVAQAVVVSRAVFPEDTALHAVVAREDDYADALAGSALAFGAGPLLFTSSQGPLAQATRAELERALPDGARVYLLGGPAAIGAEAEAELQAMGYEAVRVSGPSREETAAAVAHEVRAVVAELGFTEYDVVMLATRANWPDAVAAGSLAAFFGVPILLTPPDALHPSTAEALAALSPALLYIVGGEAAVSTPVAQHAARAGGTPAEATIRLAGPERNATAVAVADEVELVLREFFETVPAYALGVNVRRHDGFAYVLAASVIAGAYSGVFVPVDGEEGTVLTEATQAYVQGLGIDGLVVGGTDVVADAVRERLEELLAAAQ